MQELIDYCQQESTITKEKALEFISRDQWRKQITPELRGCTVWFNEDDEVVIPTRDILYALTGNPAYFD